jgi:hypothetical protein
MKKSLSISAKLILSNLSYGIPVVVLIALMVSVYQENIKFSELELKGSAYQVVMEEAFEQLGRHSWLAQRVLLGDKSFKMELDSVSVKLDLALSKIEKVQALYGEDLQFTDKGLSQRQREHARIEILKKEWGELKSQQAGLKSEVSLEKHAHLIADIRTMITHLGDTSNLILDPDLDSYYLMDVTLAALPQMQERLIDIITRGYGIVRQKTISKEDEKWLITSAALLKSSDLDRYTGDIQTSLNEDKNFYGISSTLQSNIPIGLEKSKKNVEELLKILDVSNSLELINNGVTSEKFIAAAEASYNSSFLFWRNGAKELDHLLQTRIEFQVNKRNQSLLYSIFALICAGFASTFLGVSIVPELFAVYLKL